jgi:hypothetical protein
MDGILSEVGVFEGARVAVGVAGSERVMGKDVEMTLGELGEISPVFELLTGVSSLGTQPIIMNSQSIEIDCQINFCLIIV